MKLFRVEFFLSKEEFRTVSSLADEGKMVEYMEKVIRDHIAGGITKYAQDRLVLVLTSLILGVVALLAVYLFGSM